MTTVLLTGFEVFDGHRSNPSWDAVERMAAGWTDSETIVPVRLPVVFREAASRLADAVAAHDPELIVGFGLAAGRAEVTPERIAVNVRDGRIPDNAGAVPVDEPIAGDGPAAYFSTLPVKAIVAALRDAGIPSTVSNTAGTFVCNDVFYATQHLLAGTGARSGFIHVPATPETGAESGVPVLPLESLVEAVRIAVRVSLDASADLRVAGGAVS